MKVFVKWGSERYDLELDPSSPVTCFKRRLQELTGVPVDRQRLLLKGQQIKNDQEWSSVRNLVDSATFMLIGSAEELPVPPSERPVFIEDIPPEQLNEKLELPAGLANLENTCYLNSTLQCLFKIKELREFVIAQDRRFSDDLQRNVCVSLANLFEEMKSAVSVNPFAFVVSFRAALPDFAERNNNGYIQHDAEEAWNKLLLTLSHSYPGCPIKECLEIQYETSWTPLDGSHEPHISRSDDLRMTCHLVDSQVSNLQLCITASLKQTVTKKSEHDGVERQYETVSRIAKLPRYICVHLARFYWRSDIQKRVKIRRNVKFPMELDAKAYCTPQLAATLEDGGAVYNLCALVTHIGSSSDSGHYISWAKHEKMDTWFMVDDDKVRPAEPAEVLRTSGQSADSHIAYILLYSRAEPVPQKDSELSAPATSSSLASSSSSSSSSTTMTRQNPMQQ